MKTTEAKHTSTAHLSYTNIPFFQKNGEGAFFSDRQTDVQTKPFFSTQAEQPFIQTKLTIGRPGDKYEQEADAMADRVVQWMSDPETIQTKPAISLGFGITSLVQPKCAACEEEEQIQKKEEGIDRLENGIQLKPVFESDEPPLEVEILRKCAECDAEEKLQRKGKADSSKYTSMSSLENRLSSSKGSGNPLPDTTRGQMESSFSADFSKVRIHTGSSAVQMNKELYAQAFTHNSDIYFNSGKYNLESTEGKHLLAHELTHLVQQKSNAAPQIRRKVVDDDTHVPCRSTRAGAVETLRTAEEDAIKLARRAAVIIYVHRAFHQITQITGESTGLRAFRDVLWRRFHFDFNHPQVRDTLLPIWERRFKLVADWINRLNHRYVCGAPGTEPPGECTTRPGEGYAWTATGVNETQLCDDFWGRSPEDLAGSILHEWLHFGFGWLGDCEQRHNRNNTKCYDMFARELAGTATPSDYETCCTSPSDSLPPLAGTP